MKSSKNDFWRFTYRYLEKSGNKQIQNKLAVLYPGRDREALVRDYYQRKIKMELLVICFSVLFIILAAVSIETGSEIYEGGKINRPLQNSSKEKELIAHVDDMDIPIDVEILKREYSKEETRESYELLVNEIDKIILGNNDSLNHITSDMYLPARIEGYPFSLQWISSRYNLINDSGKICEEEISQTGEKAVLTCHFYYMDYEFIKEFEITIYPKEMTMEEQTKKEIIASILIKQYEYKYKNYLQLPLSIGEKEISWKESSGYTMPVLAILICITIVGLWWGVDNDLTKRCEKRDQLLRLDYSEFVSKLQLLISSGMTIRGALERMEADYKINARKKGEKYVYEELSICLKRLRDGASETSIYQMFGSRCGLLCYKKLVSLLIQNASKGNSGLVEALSYEAKAAFEERKHIARRMGDEAQVKLLLPMTLMLCIVMIIILVPAYFSFGI